MQIWELTARARIHELIASCAHAGDSGRMGALLALFHDDAVLRVETSQLQTHPGRSKIRAFLERVASEAAQRDAERLRHHVSTISIAVDSPTTAHSRSYVMVVGEQGPDHWGTYHDRFERSGDGAWRFVERSFRMEGSSARTR